MKPHLAAAAAFAASFVITAGIPGGTVSAAPARPADAPAASNALVTPVADVYSTRRQRRVSARTSYRSPRVVYRNRYITRSPRFYAGYQGAYMYPGAYYAYPGAYNGYAGAYYSYPGAYYASDFDDIPFFGDVLSGIGSVFDSGRFGFYGTSQCFMNCRTEYGPATCRTYCGWGS
jgi:hypothetical protein